MEPYGTAFAGAGIRGRIHRPRCQRESCDRFPTRSRPRASGDCRSRARGKGAAHRLRRAKKGSTMATKIVIPSVGESITEGTISRWLKKDGDQVRQGEPIVEI